MRVVCSHVARSMSFWEVEVLEAYLEGASAGDHVGENLEQKEIESYDYEQETNCVRRSPCNVPPESQGG